VVSSSGSLATHLTERWVPHLGVRAVQETEWSLKKREIDELVANIVRKGVK